MARVLRAVGAAKVPSRLDERAGVSHVLSVRNQLSAWTPGRIASVSVLALAVGAFVVDKAILGHSEPSGAAADVAPPAATTGSSRAAVQAAESLAHRLKQHRASATVPAGKAFIAPAGFFPEVDEVEGLAEVAPEQASVLRIEWPRLGAVVTGTSPGAILDGRLVRIGESVGEFALVSVSERSVTVRHGEHEAVLTLDESNR